MAWSLESEMHRSFNNSAGGGINYGGRSPSSGALTKGGKGGSSSKGASKSAPYNPEDYKNHFIVKEKDWHQEAHWNGEGPHGERCDGWVSTYAGSSSGAPEHIPLPPCDPNPKPVPVSWKTKPYQMDWYF